MNRKKAPIKSMQFKVMIQATRTPSWVLSWYRRRANEPRLWLDNCLLQTTNEDGKRLMVYLGRHWRNQEYTGTLRATVQPYTLIPHDTISGLWEATGKPQGTTKLTLVSHALHHESSVSLWQKLLHWDPCSYSYTVGATVESKKYNGIQGTPLEYQELCTVTLPNYWVIPKIILRPRSSTGQRVARPNYG